MPIPTSYPKPGEVFVPGTPANGGKEYYPNAPKPEEAVPSPSEERPEAEDNVVTPVSPVNSIAPPEGVVIKTNEKEVEDPIPNPRGITRLADIEEKKFIDGIQNKGQDKEEITGLV